MTKYRLISADSHVTEPLELLSERLPESMRHRAPHFETRDGAEYMIVEGTYPRKWPKERSHRQTDDADVDRSAKGGWNPSQRIKDQDVDGVVGEVIYPQHGLFVFLSPDAELQMAMARVYNDWVSEVFIRHSDRFVPAALIPALDVDKAIEEVQRVVKMGFRTVFLPAHLDAVKRHYNDPMYDKLWAVIQDGRVPVGFHAASGHEARGERGLGGAVINYILHAQGSGPYLVSYLCASGIMERFPGIHFITVETGSAWLAWVLQSLDQIYKDHFTMVNPKLKELPSQYWRQKGHVTFQDDPIGVTNRAFTGVEPLLWGSDYPHSEGTWPHSQEAISKQLAGVAESEARQIVGGTAANIYNLELP